MSSLAKSTESPEDYKFYPTVPKRSVSYNFMICFFLYALVLIFQVVSVSSKRMNTMVSKPKLQRYVNIMIPFIIGCFFESIGYMARIISANNIDSLAPFLVQATAILIAPTLYAATIYMYVGEFIKALRVEKLSIINPKYLTNFFVAGDVISFLLQGNGAGLLANKSSVVVLIGRIMIIAGLFVNVAFFGLFCITQVILYYRIHRQPTNICTVSRQFPSKLMNWRSFAFVLSFISILIMIRSVYRAAEYVQGDKGSISRNQVLLYVLDSAMMSSAGSTLVWFNIPYFLVMFEHKFGEYDDQVVIVQDTDNKAQSQPQSQASMEIPLAMFDNTDHS